MIKKILLIFFSTIFALLLIEGGLRINGVNPWQYLTIKEQPTINKNDDTIGWVPKPGNYNFEPYSPKGKNFKFSILKDGTRYSGNIENKKKEIILLGGSVTQGWAVDDAETFAWYLQKKLEDYSVKNYGVSGYGTFQSYLTLERILKKTNKVKYIIYAYIQPHEFRNIGNENWLKILTKFSPKKEVFFPFATLSKEGELIRNKPISYIKLPLREKLSLVNKIEKRIMKMKMYSKNKDEILITKKIIEEMINLAKKNNSKFILVNISDDKLDLKPYENFIRINDVRTINCAKKPNKSLTVEGEGHPNKVMHEFYGECIYKGLKLRF